MFKNVLVVVLLAVTAFASYKWLHYKAAYNVLMSEKAVLGAGTAKTPPRTPPALLKKGDDFKKTAVYKFATLIFPGTLSQKAQKALNGFDMKTSTLSGGDTQVTLTSKDSDDQSQVYTVKQGESLYFIEMTPNDDKVEGHDANLRDDYGVVVDQNGLVQ